MNVEEGAEAPLDHPSNRRCHPRHAVDEAASLVLIKHNATVTCRVIDVSVTGCRLRTVETYLPGIQSRVEVSFKIHGVVFRFNGLAQWTDDCRTVGICFVDATSRRLDELAEIIGEVAAENAAKVAKIAAEERAAEELAELEERLREQDEAEAQAAIETLAVAKTAVAKPIAAPWLPTAGPTKPAQRADVAPRKVMKSERRSQIRHEVDTSAEICLITIGASMAGRILDLSPGGCHIRMDENFSLGIYIRVETVFRLHGLPFRLGGVIQAVHDRRNVGIRFLDMSERKREYLDQLIEEIEEMSVRQQTSGPADK